MRGNGSTELEAAEVGSAQEAQQERHSVGPISRNVATHRIPLDRRIRAVHVGVRAAAVL